MYKRHVFFAIAALTIAAAFVQPAHAQMDMLPSLMPFHFDSQPPLTAQAGVPYNYTVHLFVKDSTAIVRYKADRSDPPGFSVDSASGVVTWTPAARGWYSHFNNGSGCVYNACIGRWPLNNALWLPSPEGMA